MLTPFATFSAEAEELFDAGDQIAVVVKTRARPAASAAEIEIRNGHLWSFRDGKVVSLQIFPAPEDALEAAGIRD
jgi:ketosteroid isomerase-like protein